MRQSPLLIVRYSADFLFRAGLYIATLRVGYRDPIDLSTIAEPIRNRIVELERRSGDDDIERRVSLIDNAMAHAVTHM